MINSVYKINKGINKPIEFKGLKGQYIWYLGSGILILLIAFAICYISGIHTFVCIGLVLLSGTLLFLWVYRISDKYGEHGLMKKMAQHGLPSMVKMSSRNLFLLKK